MRIYHSKELTMKKLPKCKHCKHYDGSVFGVGGTCNVVGDECSYEEKRNDIFSETYFEKEKKK